MNKDILEHQTRINIPTNKAALYRFLSVKVIEEFSLITVVYMKIGVPLTR